jgi:hypothetical protein
MRQDVIRHLCDNDQCQRHQDVQVQDHQLQPIVAKMKGLWNSGIVILTLTVVFSGEIWPLVVITTTARSSDFSVCCTGIVLHAHSAFKSNARTASSAQRLRVLIYWLLIWSACNPTRYAKTNARFGGSFIVVGRDTDQRLIRTPRPRMLSQVPFDQLKLIHRSTGDHANVAPEVSPSAEL